MSGAGDALNAGPDGAGRVAGTSITLAKALGALAALIVVAMMGMVAFEVAKRSLTGASTFWVVEVSTYLLVAMAFIGLAYTQWKGAHLSVDFLLVSLSESMRDTLGRLAMWIVLFFLALLTWQMGAHVLSEYVNDTRDWGLLATPQWIPKTPLFLGLLAFLIYLVSERVGTAPEEARRRGIPAVALVFAVVLGLVALGRFPVDIPGTSLDRGSLLVFGGVVTLALLLDRLRVALLLAAVLAGTAVVFFLLEGMSLPVTGVIIGVVIVLYLLAGVQIWAALGLVGLFGLYFLLPQPQLAVIAERSWASLNSFAFTAVPMFLLMGNMLVRSGVTSDLFESFSKWTSWAPGGLGLAAVGSSGIFAALSGSSLATAATIGQIAGPEMIRRGYSPRLAAGAVAGGGTLGILIPPSIPMIVYGSTVGAPITDLFIAAIIPGLVMMASMVGAISIWSLLVKGSAPPTRAHGWREMLASVKGTAPFIILILAVLGSIYFGIVTVTEAGALSAVLATLLCLLHGKLTWAVLVDVTLDTVKVTSYILIIVAGAAVLSWVVDYLGIPRTIVGLFEDARFPPWVLMALVTVLYVVLGMFLDPVSMMLMTLPVTYPLVQLAGFDGVWFGVALMMLIEVGLITPPVGIVLFVLRATLPRIPFKDIILGALPFVLVILANVALIHAFPGLATWLPSHMAR